MNATKKILASLTLLCLIVSTSFAQKKEAKPAVDAMKAAEFKIYNSLAAVLKDFDFEAKCSIQSFTLHYIPKREDAIELKGMGAYFTRTISRAVQAAKRGDQYAFTDVKARCPGDIAARRVNGLTFQIK
ncbi:MAG: hypothetical protein GY810_31570 [Aureispira sp.]|nr:hypothetical protein [Aureispira sp.]